MTPAVADALVLFGATGDLAKRKLFPALYHLERRGRLELPVIGVGRSQWDHDALRDYARAAVKATKEPIDEDALDRLTTDSHGQRRVRRTEHLRPLAANSKTATPRVLPRDPPECSTIVKGLESSKLTKAQHRRREPFGRDLARRKLNETLHEVFAESRSFASTTTSARVGRESLVSVSPILPRANLESQLRRQRADHMARLWCRGSRRVLRLGGCDPRRRAESPAARIAYLGMEHQSAPGRRLRNERSGLEGDEAARLRSARAGSTPATERKRVSPSRRSRPSLRCISRSSRGGGRRAFYVRAGKALATTALEAVAN